MSSSTSEEYEEPSSEEELSAELQLPSSSASSEEEAPRTRRKRQVLPQIEIEPKQPAKPHRIELPIFVPKPTVQPEKWELPTLPKIPALPPQLPKLPTIPALPPIPQLPKPTRREAPSIETTKAVTLMARDFSETETELVARKELVSYLLSKRPDLYFQVAEIISHMILNKCKYGVVYNSEAELVLSRLMRS